MGCDYYYWSTIAKLMHAWRANAVRIFKIWNQLYPDGSAMHATSKVPPRPITGRWGSVRDCENHILRCDPDRLTTVLHSALGGDPRAEIDHAKMTGLAELGVAEQVACSAQMGKWTKDALDALRDPFFWLAIR
eukprot:9358281-Pyramimonas_sp.AAC.1